MTAAASNDMALPTVGVETHSRAVTAVDPTLESADSTQRTAQQTQPAENTEMTDIERQWLSFSNTDMSSVDTTEEAETGDNWGLR